MSDKNHIALEAEVLRLFELVQKLREDLASVQGADGQGQVLDSAADQLQEIAQESETATFTILDSVERIHATSAQLQTEIKYSGARQIFQDMIDDSQKIMEACQMHDIIGERISKIVRTINLVEGTLNSLVVTVGNGGITGLPTALSGINMMDGDLELTGPAVKNEGLVQEDVDALFEKEDA